MQVAGDWADRPEFWERVEGVLFDTKRWDLASVEVDQMLALTGVEPPGDVLDMCCGPGRHCFEIARRGFHVVGVDRTEHYLKLARDRGDSLRLHVSFICADAREFLVPASFDLAINVFASFGYFESEEDDLGMLENLAGSLRQGGKLVLSCPGKEASVRRFRPRHWQETGRGLLLEESELTANFTHRRTRWVVIEDGETHTVRFQIRLYSATELTHMLRHAGFRSVATFGDLDGRPYDLDAERLVAVATR
jgi:SAM-dependent methyltransferase